MNEIILNNLEKNVPPKIPTEWDFGEANKDFDKHIHNWRRLTGDVISELWIFYNKLARPGKRTDLGANAPGWQEWLESKGIGKDTPLRHFKALGWLPGKAHVSLNTGENEWYTPPKFVEAARKVMGGIDTDPASTHIANKTVKADVFYDIEADGLEQQWQPRVWMNPPYAQPQVSQFCNALIKKLGTGEVQQACVLINNTTETAFGQKLLGVCAAVCFPSGRVKFLDKKGNEGAPLQGQMIVYFGDDADKFCSEFTEIGVCLFG